MKRLVLAACLLVAVRAHADTALARTAFEQAEQYRKAGDWKTACDLYKESHAQDPQLGVLLHLANCNEKLGRFATAWALFSDAIDLAHAKADPRERIASERAAALEPRIAKLRIERPATDVPGLVVRRDGSDVTVMLGGAMPLDPGAHEVSASAPGFTEWKTTITVVNSAKTVELTIPPLVAAPTEPVAAEPAAKQTGMLHITTLPMASIMLDGEGVGRGEYKSPVAVGEHTIQIIATGKRAYLNRITVALGGNHVIDAPLETEYVPPPTRPGFEVAASVVPGRKLRGDRPSMIGYRAEASFHVGTRVSLGAFAELGSIEASNACGYDMPGPSNTTPFDYGTRYHFGECRYVKLGGQLYANVLAAGRIIPYVGFLPAVRFATTEFTPYVANAAGDTQRERFVGYTLGARLGVDVHPHPRFDAWVVGLFVEPEYTVRGQESCSACDGGTGIKDASYLSVFGGLRSGVAF